MDTVHGQPITVQTVRNGTHDSDIVAFDFVETAPLAAHFITSYNNPEVELVNDHVPKTTRPFSAIFCACEIPRRR